METIKNKDIELFVKNYLKMAFNLDQTLWVSQDELLAVAPGLKETKPTSHDKCPKLWSIINNLNKYDDHVYLTKNFSYKIATKEEAIKYKENYFNKRIAPKLKRYRNMKKKINEDGQGNVFSENEFKEVFIKNEKGE